MSHAVQALLLIRLDARRGEIVGVQELADHYGLSPDLVRAELEQLHGAGSLQCERTATSQTDFGVITGAMTFADAGDR